MIRIAFLSLASACLLFPLAGCSSEFKDQKEELAYLESLSNPTPSQWKRREELREQMAGCSSEFKDQKEELAYLESLSNPTPGRWKRREELREQKKYWPPELHSVVALPEGETIPVYATLDSFRQASAMLKAGHAINIPQLEAAEKYRITSLWPGCKVRIMGIGDDWVHIYIICDPDGNSIKRLSRFEGPAGQEHGYAEKWWEPKYWPPS